MLSISRKNIPDDSRPGLLKSAAWHHRGLDRGIVVQMTVGLPERGRQTDEPLTELDAPRRKLSEDDRGLVDDLRCQGRA